MFHFIVSHPFRLSAMGLVITALSAGGLSGLTGCTATPTALDLDFGQSSRQTGVLQTLDTQAYARAKPALGTDGQTASLVVERYYKTVELPPQPIRIMNSGVGVVPVTGVSR